MRKIFFVFALMGVVFGAFADPGGGYDPWPPWDTVFARIALEATYPACHQQHYNHTHQQANQGVGPIDYGGGGRAPGAWPSMGSTVLGNNLNYTCTYTANERIADGTSDCRIGGCGIGGIRSSSMLS